MLFIEAALTNIYSTINQHLGCQILFQYSVFYERNMIYQSERYEQHQCQRQPVPRLTATSIQLSSQCISIKSFLIFSTCPICSPPITYPLCSILVPQVSYTKRLRNTSRHNRNIRCFRIHQLQ
jgi:hypothetical protein